MSPTEATAFVARARQSRRLHHRPARLRRREPAPVPARVQGHRSLIVEAMEHIGVAVEGA